MFKGNLFYALTLRMIDWAQTYTISDHIMYNSTAFF